LGRDKTSNACELQRGRTGLTLVHRRPLEKKNKKGKKTEEGGRKKKEKGL